MRKVGQRESQTQQEELSFSLQRLGYCHLDDWKDRDGNYNVEENLRRYRGGKVQNILGPLPRLDEQTAIAPVLSEIGIKIRAL